MVAMGHHDSKSPQAHQIPQNFGFCKEHLMICSGDT